MPHEKCMLFLRSFVLLFLATSTYAGTVQTLDGKTYEGDVHFENGNIVVHPKTGQPIKLELADISQANLQNTEPPRIIANSSGLLDRQWKTQDVGPTGTAGSARLVDGTFAIKGAGSDIKGPADSFFFAYQELRGDGQIIARLSNLPITQPEAKAGVMIRESFNERGSKTAFVFLKPQDGSSFAWRSVKGADLTATPLAAGDKAPAWLRLTRVRNTFSASKSMDGNAWVNVGEPQEIPMDSRVYVGLAVCSRDINAVCAARFEGVNIQPGRPKDEAPAKLGGADSSHPSGPVLSRAVILRNGSILGNVNIQSADEKNVQFTRADGKTVSVSTNEVARLILAPSTPVQLSKIPPSALGVMMAKGDFLEGDFVSLQKGRVKINSVVFGPKDLAVGGEAAVVVLHEPGSSQANWVVRTKEGFVYMARAMKMDKDQLLIEDETAGTIKVGGGNISEIKLGGGRVASLVDVPPSKIEVDAGLSPATAYSIHRSGGPVLTLGGQSCERGILCQAGASLRFDLDGNYKVFLCRAGIPDGVLPTTATRLLVLADNQEIYRSGPQSSLNAPLSVSVKVTGVKSLVLRVEHVGEAHLPASMLWSEPMLVK